jgi:hypothetical protein
MSTRFDTTSSYRSVARRSLLRFGVVGAGTLILRSTYAQKADQAGSEEVKGEAFAETGSERRPLNRAAPLFIKQVGTGTDARATLLLGRATTLRMGENTAVTIDRFLVNAGGEITLQSGPILFDGPSGIARMQIRIRFDRGTRHSILCRSEQRCVWCVRCSRQCERCSRGKAGFGAVRSGH